MKKLIAILTSAVFFCSAVFANDDVKDNIARNRRVMDSFNREFAGAVNVSWYSTDKSHVAKFTVKESKVTAHFDNEGRLLATSRYITDSDLPLKVMNRLVKKYPNQRINNVVEYEYEGLTTYVVTLESATHWTVLKAEPAGWLTTINKLRKG